MYHMLFFPGGMSPSPGTTSPVSLSSPGSGTYSGDEYTFFLPKKVFSDEAINFLKSLSPVMDTETLFLHAKTSDVLSGAVQDPMFWQDNKYWNFTNDVQTGYLPSTIDQNSFNITDIKLFEETFTVPENGIVFFVVNNLDGKSDFIWTLTDAVSGEEIVRAKSVPFFVWKFKDLGTFNIKADVFDNRGTQYTTYLQNYVRVLDKKDYTLDIESRLNTRKLQLLKNRV